VYSQIGLITLVGLISKHGILIVEFSNQLRQQGKGSIGEAVVEAASLRLRPILMTTGAMVLGALPLALASGAGAESRQQIGWVIVGGMSVGTLLTIFVVPTMYTLFARRRPRARCRDQPAPQPARARPPRLRPRRAARPAATGQLFGQPGNACACRCPGNARLPLPMLMFDRIVHIDDTAARTARAGWKPSSTSGPTCGSSAATSRPTR
jgi:hypothetical protein